MCPGCANTLLSHFRTFLSGLAQVDIAGKQVQHTSSSSGTFRTTWVRSVSFQLPNHLSESWEKNIFFYSRSIYPAKANKILEETFFSVMLNRSVRTMVISFFFFNLTLFEISGWDFFKKTFIRFIKYVVMFVVLQIILQWLDSS